MSELMTSAEMEDMEAIIRMVMTSPQLAKITQRISLMMEKLEPLMTDSEYMAMFSSVRDGFSTLNQFFQNSTLMLSSIVKNWQSIEYFVIKEDIFSQKELESIADTLISPQLLFSLFQKLEDFQCNEESVTRYVEFYNNQALLNTSLQSMVEATCGFVKSEHLIELLSVINLDSAVDYLMSIFELSPSSLATSSNLTPEELQASVVMNYLNYLEFTIIFKIQIFSFFDFHLNFTICDNTAADCPGCSQCWPQHVPRGPGHPDTAGGESQCH